jgi:hypothetical protein
MFNPKLSTRRSIINDVIRAATEAIKDSMTFDRIGNFLPFKTSYVSGFTLNHIQSESAFAIKTDTRLVLEGETLCGRQSPYVWEGASRKHNCPGCEAIGKGLAVRDL